MSIENIKQFIYKKHDDVGQKYGTQKYSFHLLNVLSVAQEFTKNHPESMMIQEASLLHDIKEDTDATDVEILGLTSPVVLDIINRLTDKQGHNRKERHLNTYYLIRERENAVLVKLFDRISNIRYAIKTQSKFRSMYVKESLTFMFALYDPRHKYAQQVWKAYTELINQLHSKK